MKSCNNCDTKGCNGAQSVAEMEICNKHLSPIRGFRLVELALAYPDSLNQSLSELKFKVRIKDYI